MNLPSMVPSLPTFRPKLGKERYIRVPQKYSRRIVPSLEKCNTEIPSFWIKKVSTLHLRRSNVGPGFLPVSSGRCYKTTSFISTSGRRSSPLNFEWTVTLFPVLLNIGKTQVVFIRDLIT